MKIRVLYFASLRERAGLSESAEEVPPGSTTGSVWELIRARPSFSDVKAGPGFAVNGEWCGPDVRLKSGDTLGLLPPVSGG